MRRTLALPWTLAVAAAALIAVGAVLQSQPGGSGDQWWVYALWIGLVTGTIAVGLLVAVRRPGHPIGLLLLANALILAAAGAAEGYARYALLDHLGTLPGARWVALYDQSAWPLLFVAVAAVAFVFPDGHLPSPRWRPVAVGAGVAFALVILSSMGRPFERPFDGVTNPLAGLPPVLDVLGAVALPGLLASLLAAVWAVRVRFRQAIGIERLQLKWLAYSAGAIPVALLLGLATRDDSARTASIFVMSGALTAGVGIGVMRYRLYEIDRLINRTLVYGVLTLLLGAAYAAIALAVGVTAGGSSSWTAAGATLAVAAAFRPLRARVQRGVDRRFARARYEALRSVEAFLADLRGDLVAPEAIEGILAEALGDPTLELHYWLTAGELYADAGGTPVGERPGDGRARTPVSRGGAPMAVVVHDAALDERPHLLTSVIEAAGLAIEIARLRVELRRQLEEVEASRARIVAAGYDERRRIERDLHDGAQQRLVSIGLALRHLQHELPAGAASADTVIDEVVAEVGGAIDELRELARGVHPSQLDDGIGPALQELAGRASVPVDVRATPERFPSGVEAAAYFIVCEGLTNAVKHARASAIVVSAERQNGSLVVSVSDDGVGGAVASAGSGLTGLADRVAAQGGTLRLSSPASGGTILTVELPCAS